MRFADVIAVAFTQIRENKLRSFFTLVGIIVSVTFLVAVVAIISGMNAYVSEKLAGALIGKDAFQVRRVPIQVGFFDDEEWRRLQRRPRITHDDADAVIRAIPEAAAVSLQSGWPAPVSDVFWRSRTIADVTIFGVTPDYQVVQDYVFERGHPLSEVDIRERRFVAVIGNDISEKLFENVDAVGQSIRIRGVPFEVVGVVEKKGRVLGQSFDGFVLLPLPTFEMVYGRRKTTTISVKMPAPEMIGAGMSRAEEAMREQRGLRPGQDNDFTVETADALVAFWQNLTKVLFSVVPAIVAIGIVVGGIVIMNIMMMSVTERTHEIGVRKAMGATRRDIRRQFLTESVVLSAIGGLLGVAGGWALATLVSTATPLPARVSLWSVILAITLGAGVGIIFGVYPASRAAALDPIDALRAE
ncbi:MAG TPA: ABC transporter permease [Gemmatimonadaceae bacterium]|nr:ABC transporter permease [Gemmatimonadaceae bacterium]